MPPPSSVSGPECPSPYIPAVALDCEMVGCGPNAKVTGLGRISIIDTEGGVIMDEFVKPMEPVADYRSHITGLYPHHLSQAIPFLLIREKAVSILKDRIVVGHAVHNDFNVLCFHPPQELVRDTSFYKPLRYAKACRKGNGSGLRKLVKHWFNEDVQGGAHDSVEDARMAMRLYLLVRQDWEARHSRVLSPHYAKWGLAPSVSLPLNLPLNLPLYMHAQWMTTAKSKPKNVPICAPP
eukprot:GHVS01104903.1.p1 GENE.GHVS01104903.1~~GHVS01104903.1.p1  ORF type:complete len:237 (+),score=19.57 GHVS01104903.1:89-799(+)